MDGYDTPPMIMMGHSRPYYAARLTAEGYQGVKDLLAYRLSAHFTSPEFMEYTCLIARVPSPGGWHSLKLRVAVTQRDTGS